MASRIYKGCLIASTLKSEQKGLWFVFHAEGNDVLGLDLTHQHPAIEYKSFANVLHAPDRKDEKDKIVLMGGSMNPDDALSILHETQQQPEDSVRIDENFSLRTYRYVLIPGKPPEVVGNIKAASTIAFKSAIDFLIIMGFKVWEMPKLNADIDNGLYKIVPATKEIVFETSAQDRLTKALHLIH